MSEGTASSHHGRSVEGQIVFRPRSDFFNTLKARVDAYFQQNGIRPTGDARLYLKTVVGYGLIIAGYALCFGVGLVTISLSGDATISSPESKLGSCPSLVLEMFSSSLFPLRR